MNIDKIQKRSQQEPPSCGVSLGQLFMIKMRLVTIKSTTQVTKFKRRRALCGAISRLAQSSIAKKMILPKNGTAVETKPTTKISSMVTRVSVKNRGKNQIKNKIAFRFPIMTGNPEINPGKNRLWPIDQVSAIGQVGQ